MKTTETFPVFSVNLVLEMLCSNTALICSGRLVRNIVRLSLSLSLGLFSSSIKKLISLQGGTASVYWDGIFFINPPIFESKEYLCLFLFL